MAARVLQQANSFRYIRPPLDFMDSKYTYIGTFDHADHNELKINTIGQLLLVEKSIWKLKID